MPRPQRTVRQKKQIPSETPVSSRNRRINVRLATPPSAQIQVLDETQESGSGDIQQPQSNQDMPPTLSPQIMEAIAKTVQSQLVAHFSPSQHANDDDPLKKSARGTQALGGLEPQSNVQVQRDLPNPALGGEGIQAQEISQQSLESVINALLSEKDQHDTGPQIQTGMLQSCEELPLDILVPQKVKDKIIGGQYVDLPSLLFPDSGLQTFQINQSHAGTPSVKVSSPTPKRILHMDQWMKAMHIYGSIFLPTKPADIQSFFKYLEFIHNLSERSSLSAALRYDEFFRRIREHTIRPWDQPLVLNYVQALAQGSQSNFRAPTKQAPRTYNPLYRNGFCNKFQDGKGKECIHPCRYIHKCSKCRANHPASKCNMPRANNPSASDSRPNDKSFHQ